MKIFASILVIFVAAMTLAQGMSASSAPEMKRLEPLAGRWVGTVKYVMAGAPAEPVKSTVVTDSFGGYQRTIYTLTAPGLSFEGTMYTSWDAKEKTFRSWVFDNHADVPREELGGLEGAALVMVSKPHGGTVTRTSFTPVGKDGLDLLIEIQVDGKWQKVGSGSYKRSR